MYVGVLVAHESVRRLSDRPVLDCFVGRGASAGAHLELTL
jgi:hypothetical protein